MIKMTRRQARGLRGLLQRLWPNHGPDDSVCPLILVAEAGQVQASIRVGSGVIQLRLPGPADSGTSLALPLAALVEIAGADDTPVELAPLGPGRTAANWRVHGVAQAREFAVAVPDLHPPDPTLPDRWEVAPAGLLDALAAFRVLDTGVGKHAGAEGSLVLLRGGTGELVAGNARQILVQGGLAFPWDDDVAVRGPLVPLSRTLHSLRSVALGRTASHVVLRAGPWTVYSAVSLETDLSDALAALPTECEPVTRLALAPADARLVARTLAWLPGGEEPDAPVLLELDVTIRLRAPIGGPSRATELVLGRSRVVGPPARVVTSRLPLARALRLGLAELTVGGTPTWLVARHDRRRCSWPAHALAPDPRGGASE